MKIKSLMDAYEEAISAVDRGEVGAGAKFGEAVDKLDAHVDDLLQKVVESEIPEQERSVILASAELAYFAVCMMRRAG